MIRNSYFCVVVIYGVRVLTSSIIKCFGTKNLSDAVIRRGCSHRIGTTQMTTGRIQVGIYYCTDE